MANAVVIKGLQELSRSFNKVNQQVNSQCKKVMRRLVRKVAADAKAAAPVGRGRITANKETGKSELVHYRDTIKYSMAKNGMYGWAYAGKKGESKRGYLGHLLEYGTVRTRAIPHFMPALDKARIAFEPALKAAIASVKGGA